MQPDQSRTPGDVPSILVDASEPQQQVNHDQDAINTGEAPPSTLLSPPSPASSSPPSPKTTSANAAHDRFDEQPDASITSPTAPAPHRVRFSSDIQTRPPTTSYFSNNGDSANPSFPSPVATSRRKRSYSLRSALRGNLRTSGNSPSDDHTSRPSTANDSNGAMEGYRLETIHSLSAPPSEFDRAEPRPSVASSRYRVDEFEWPDSQTGSTGRRLTFDRIVANFARTASQWRVVQLMALQRRKARRLYRKAKAAVVKVNEIRPSLDGRKVPVRLERRAATLPKNSTFPKKGTQPGSDVGGLKDERTSRPYIDNSIRTRRYSIWTFLPRQLVAQFCKVANFYFLCVSILQLIPGMSTTGRVTTIIPLMIFVGIAITKEGVDDWRRAKGDWEENGRNAMVAERDEGSSMNMAVPLEKKAGASLPTQEIVSWKGVHWQDVRVGDVVRLVRDEAVPADLVVLDVPGSESGLGYVETMALDGETNLKSKGADPNLRDVWNCEKTWSGADPSSRPTATVVVEDPNQDLYRFDGRIEIQDASGTRSSFPLSNSHVIYRGSIIRNTPVLIGLVVYTGEECKMRMNANRHVRIKAPRLQADVNRVIVLIVVLVLLLSIGSAASHIRWENTVARDSWYLEDAEVGFGQNVASMFLMFNTLIPISLYVSLEIVKLAQVWLMESDVDMWMPFKMSKKSGSKRPRTADGLKEAQPKKRKHRLKWKRKTRDQKQLVDGIGCEAHTSTINEELGQVGYVFSDKTGTLTENEMQVRKISVGGIVWRLDEEPNLLETEPFCHSSESDSRAPDPKLKSKSKHLESSSSAHSNASHSQHRTSDARRSTSGALSPARLQTNSLREPQENGGADKENKNELLSQQLLDYVASHPRTSFARRVIWMLVGVAVCHGALPERDEEEESMDCQDGGQLRQCFSQVTSSTSGAGLSPISSKAPAAPVCTGFQSSSPDEVALVQAAYDVGFCLEKRDGNQMTVRMPAYAAEALGHRTGFVPPSSAPGSGGSPSSPVSVNFPILNVIPFSSRRRRMTVLVRLPSGMITLFCKGADSVISARLGDGMAQLSKKYVAEIEGRMKKWKEEEVQAVLARESISRPSLSRPSFSRPSISRPSMSYQPSRPSFSRPSINLPRPSMSAPLEQLFEQDGHREPDPAFYAPRPSVHIGPDDKLLTADSSPTEKGVASPVADDELVEESMTADDEGVLYRCLQHIHDFSSAGLRTLLYGYRTVSEDEYKEWSMEFATASTSLVDRDELVEAVGARIEGDLQLAGGTAIEDRLQKGVPETIGRLRRAGIKVWMLTGDKKETAINIGHSCGLIRESSDVFIIGGSSCENEDAGSGDGPGAAEQESLQEQIGDALEALSSRPIAHAVVVIDGPTLGTVNTDKALRRLFFILVLRADAVVCCRASPSQKALLVHAIRKRTSAITLAIGDGANDIAMIQEAHVGIGIAGREGLQAARVSDYSIAQFRFLTKLLLVHGRWNYVRTCKYTLGTFSKEIVFYLTQALFQRYNGFSGTSLHESWSLSMFNTLFTSLAVIFLGAFDQDIRAETLVAVPELYRYGAESRGFGFRVVARWIAIAAVQSLIIFFVPLSWFSGMTNPGNTDGSIFPLGTLVFTVAIILINLKLQFLVTPRMTITNAIAILVSVIGWFVWNIIIAGLYDYSARIYYVRGEFISHIGRSVSWWLCVIVTLVLALVCEVAVLLFRKAWAWFRSSIPGGGLGDDSYLIEHMERDPKTRKRLAWEARDVLIQSRGGWEGPIPEWGEEGSMTSEEAAKRERRRRKMRTVKRKVTKMKRRVLGRKRKGGSRRSGVSIAGTNGSAAWSASGGVRGSGSVGGSGTGGGTVRGHDSDISSSDSSSDEEEHEDDDDDFYDEDQWDEQNGRRNGTVEEEPMTEQDVRELLRRRGLGLAEEEEDNGDGQGSGLGESRSGGNVTSRV